MQDTKQDQGRTTPSLAMMSAGPLSKHLAALAAAGIKRDRKSTRLNSSHRT